MPKLHLIYSEADQLINAVELKPLFFIGLIVFIGVHSYISNWRSKAQEGRFMLTLMPKKAAMRIAMVWSIFSLIVFGILLGSILNEHNKGMMFLNNGNIKVVEGRVANYHPMPAGGHDTERFQVNGVPFEFADDILSAGYHHAASSGGAIRANLYVKIGYYNDGTGNHILKLETE